MARVDALPPASEPVIFQYDLDAVGTSSTDINYGVKVEHSELMPAGNYIANIVYTATVEQLRQPVLTSVTPNTYELGSNENNTITITGKYLSTASKAYLVHASTGEQYYCTNLQVTSTDASGNTTLTCNVPTDQTDPNIEPDTYGVHVLTNAGETAYTDAATFTYTKPSICRNNDPDSDCQVDIDDNMIPIVYEGYDGNGGGNWRMVTKDEMNNTGSWYDYGQKQWANAVTLRDDFEGGYYCGVLNLPLSTSELYSKDYANANDAWDKLAYAIWRYGEYSCSGVGMVKITPLLAARMYDAAIDSGKTVSDGSMVQKITDWTIYNDDVLGYWVYIPRYAYEVQRRDAVDRVVNPQNFDIVFQTADEKNAPAPSCNKADEIWVSQPSGNNSTNSSNAGPNSDNVIAKDYRTGCWPNNRTYSPGILSNPNSSTTWATHPAFSWGTEETGYTELNGLWVGKFETTGKLNAPTVKPNQHANISEYIGEFYTMARSIGTGTYSPTTNGGNTISGIAQNSHNLDSATSHMLKNSEWGAVAYLSASKYGAGVNGTQINSAYPTNGKDADGDPSGTSQARYGITGCGPYNASGSTNTYTDGTALSADLIESPTACSQDTSRTYNGSIGVLASTTNTVYGIYDMSGGAYEYVMGNLTGYDNQSETSSSSYMTTQAKPPYVDLYKESPYGNFTGGVSSGAANNPVDWGSGTYEYYWNNDICTWKTCGGHALHETKQYQSVSSYNQSWGSDYSYFVNSNNRWFRRGGYAGNGSLAGLFYSNGDNGRSLPSYGFRSALLVKP